MPGGSTGHGQPAGEAPAPPAEQLLAVPSDDWAWLLRHVRAALDTLTDSADPATARLRDAPAGRLAGGRLRRELAHQLAAGGPLWSTVHERLRRAADLPAGLRWLVDGTAVPASARPQSSPAPSPAATGRHRQELARLRERARSLQRERDEARRQLDGADARAAAAEAEVARLVETVAELERQVADLREQLAAATAERERALERERRRAGTEAEQLREQLAELRRRENERVVAERRRRAAARAASRARERPVAAGIEETPIRLRPGRPSRLPPGVHLHSREAADLLLHRGRLVLVDGYNVTKTHRPDLSLEEQRAWLLQALANAVARRGIRPTVVFDSTVVGASGRRETARGVVVRYASEGMSADDEIDFEVHALDPETPVVVVTDDRELRQRIASQRVDLLGTGPFVWAIS